MPKLPDPRTFTVTLTARQRDLLVILRDQVPEQAALSVSNDPAWALGVVIDAFDDRACPPGEGPGMPAHTWGDPNTCTRCGAEQGASQ